MKRFLLVKRNCSAKNIVSACTLVSGASFISYTSALKYILTFTASLVYVTIYARSGNGTQQDDYKKVITERAAKIINTLGLTDSPRYYKVLDVLVNQYAGINTLHEQNETIITEIKRQSLPAEKMAEAITKQEAEKSSRLLKLHSDFITHLKEHLSDDQLEKVKDGMTYRVFPVTYAAYQDMLPGLTAPQKEKIYDWLKEARELAMDAGSSEKKHAVFGKYKGRINNYLSAAGYDLKKETAAWQQRIKEKKAATKQAQR